MLVLLSDVGSQYINSKIHDGIGKRGSRTRDLPACSMCLNHYATANLHKLSSNERPVTLLGATVETCGILVVWIKVILAFLHNMRQCDCVNLFQSFEGSLSVHLQKTSD
jgi:hypothetical protein